MNAVLAFDQARGRITVESGTDWRRLIAVTRALPGSWSIIQKQTGADSMTLGGSLAVNAHGRGLDLPPLSAQVESFALIGPDGSRRHCSRTENADLFALVIGGYGMFGIVESLTLRLQKRFHVRRRVEVRTSDGLMEALMARRDAGCRFGDFQFALDPDGDDFLHRGVFACYEPTSEGLSDAPRELGEDGFRRLLMLAHLDKRKAFEHYAAHYLATDGQIYESDTHQLMPYPVGYHDAIDARVGGCGSEMITELSVPRERFAEFLPLLRAELRASGANPIYSTVRIVEPDEDSFLTWAREPLACVILNLHVDHSSAGLAAARRQFRGLIDCALARGGTFYLPYHRWATGEQLRAGHPSIDEFVAEKHARDPSSRFVSDWFASLERTLR